MASSSALADARRATSVSVPERSMTSASVGPEPFEAVGTGARPAGARRLASFAADRARRAASADRWLASLLGAEPGVALVAVGGYGRRELLPGSDLDVLLLHSGRPGIAALADRIWYPIWDSGTRLDHAVRRPAEAREVARQDVRVALGLLHARHVAGDPGLTSDLRTGVLADSSVDGFDTSPSRLACRVASVSNRLRLPTSGRQCQFRVISRCSCSRFRPSAIPASF